jgi:hypothetical protein
MSEWLREEPEDAVFNELLGFEVHYQETGELEFDSVRKKKGKNGKKHGGGGKKKHRGASEGSYDGWHDTVLDAEKQRRADIEADGGTFPAASGEGWHDTVLDAERQRRLDI